MNRKEFGYVFLAAGIFACVLTGCCGKSAKEATAEVKNSYEQTFREASAAQEDVSESYTRLNTKLSLLQEDLNNDPNADYQNQFESIFGAVPKTIDQAIEWVDSSLDYIVDEDWEHFSPIIRKFKDLETVDGSFREKEISFTVKNTADLLEEMPLSAENLGKILAATIEQGAEVSFDDKGFSFNWESQDNMFEVKLEPDPEVWLNFVQRYNECAKQFNAESGAEVISMISLDDSRIREGQDAYLGYPYYELNFFNEMSDDASMEVYLTPRKDRIDRVECTLEVTETVQYRAALDALAMGMRSRCALYALIEGLSVDQAIGISNELNEINEGPATIDHCEISFSIDDDGYLSFLIWNHAET